MAQLPRILSVNLPPKHKDILSVKYTVICIAFKNWRVHMAQLTHNLHGQAT
jgi:hypothetical protein